MARKRSNSWQVSTPEVSLRTIDGCNLVFSSSHQKVYELNEAAALIWRSLHNGRADGNAEKQLVAMGLPPSTAGAFVRTMLSELSRLGIRPPPAARARPPSGGKRLQYVIEVAGLTICFRFGSQQALSRARIFSHLAASGSAPDMVIDVIGRGQEQHVYRNGHWLDACAEEELAPFLKALLMTEILASSHYELALHAATLAHNERLLLLCGRPGAGKTTLTLALAHAGLGFAGDDLALVRANGTVTGVPFPAAVKPGSWPLIARRFPELRCAITHRRPDGRRVRYVVPRSSAGPFGHTVGWVVFLERQRTLERATLSPLPVSRALEGLLDGAHTHDSRLTTRGFSALVDCIAEARYFTLSYADLEDATRVLLRGCR